jgi:hypothetical protein
LFTDFGSDRGISDLVHEAPDAVGGFGGVLFGSGVMIQMALALGYQGRAHVRRTNLQFSLEKVDKRPLRPGAWRLVLGRHFSQVPRLSSGPFGSASLFQIFRDDSAAQKLIEARVCLHHFFPSGG